MINCDMVQCLGTKTGRFSSWLKFDFTSLPTILRTPSLSRTGSNWWIRLVLGTLFPALTASISFQKCLPWHIFITSVSTFCNMEIFWYDSSDVWYSILWYCFFCLIICVAAFACIGSLWLLASVFFNQIFSVSNRLVFYYILLTVNKCFASGSSSMMASVLSTDQEVSLCQRNSGPLNH